MIKIFINYCVRRVEVPLHEYVKCFTRALELPYKYNNTTPLIETFPIVKLYKTVIVGETSN